MRPGRLIIRSSAPAVLAMLAYGVATAAWAQNGPGGQLPPLQEQSRPQGYYPSSPTAPAWQRRPGPGNTGQSVLGGPSNPGQSILGGQGGSGQTVLGGTGAGGQNLLGGQDGLQGEGSPGQAVPPPDASAPDAPDQTQAPQVAPSVAPLAPVERPNVWVPAAVAKLEALDKVNAQATELTVKVGQAATFGSLTIAVKSCMIRPPNQPADAAAYLDVTDSHPDSPGFNGWMLQDEPAVSMMQHPIYDLRVTGCT